VDVEDMAVLLLRLVMVRPASGVGRRTGRKEPPR
jgi:hypothetical protein